MKRVERLGEAAAPDGTVLTLYRHDRDYVIRVDGQELMSTRRHHSEDVLAELVCAPLREQAGARVLIGGLGLGFTLRAALNVLPKGASVTVAELVPEHDPGRSEPLRPRDREKLRVAEVAQKAIRSVGTACSRTTAARSIGVRRTFEPQ